MRKLLIKKVVTTDQGLSYQDETISFMLSMNYLECY